MRHRDSCAAVLCCFCFVGFLGLTGCTQTGTPVTGSPQDVTTQSETTAATSFAGKNVMVVSYNDETNSDPTIKYTSSTRVVQKGASLMGWSYSLDNGQNWSYGGRVAPPAGWAVLWGDPAMTDSWFSYRYVFLSNLAIPNSKFPPGGINGSVIVSGADSYIGGACISRSTDGGVTFQNYQCVSNTDKNSVPNSEKGHFYDGGSMASARAGDVYAAYVDVTTGQIDVWHSPAVNGSFTRLASPFPGLDIVTHPRLRVDQATGNLYVAAQANNGVVFINRLQNGQWAQAVQASNPAAIYPCIAFEAGGCDAFSTKLHVRTGPQFSFDIGAPSDDSGTDAIRLLTTQLDPKSNTFFVGGSFCPLSLSPNCFPAPEWGTTPGNLSLTGDEYNPNVAAWGGFIGLPPAWKGTYLHQQAGKVSLSQGNLAYLPNGTRIYLPFDVIKDQPICPDNRGYWGDYDDLIMAGFFNGSTTASFFRPMSDSSLGCNKRWEYTSSHLHVRGFVFQ